MVTLLEAVNKALITPETSLEFDEIIEFGESKDFVINGEIRKGNMGLVPSDKGIITLCVNVPWINVGGVDSKGKNVNEIVLEIEELIKSNKLG